ncbi:MAG: hypothetical protein RBT61_00300 [Candidatus Kapabacteria bacterium]|jgi:hypothetical protein|nr:hypothetical protein [Candidatus Kapabacteria bacterium]
MSELIKISLIAYMFVALGSPGNIFYFYQRWLVRLPGWLASPLGACYKCFVGQVCLWYFIFTQPFDIIELLFWPAAGIPLSMVYDKIYNYLDL